MDAAWSKRCLFSELRLNAKSFGELQGPQPLLENLTSVTSSDDHYGAGRFVVPPADRRFTQGWWHQTEWREKWKQQFCEFFSASSASPICCCTSHDRRIVSVVQTALPRERGAVNFVLKPRQNGDTVVHTPRQMIVMVINMMITIMIGDTVVHTPRRSRRGSREGRSGSS